MDVKKTTLTAPYPFSLKATVLSHGWHECTPMTWCEGGRCFQLIERRREGVYRVSVVEASRRRQGVTLRVTIEGDGIDRTLMGAMRNRLRLILGLNLDLTEFYTICKDHPTLHVIPRIGAGHVLRSFSMMENILKMLCATNVNWTQAVKMINRLGQLGPPLRHFVHLNAWPTPREILRAGRNYLTEVCRVGYRADSILALCQDVCAGRFDPEEVNAMASSQDTGSDEILSCLRSVHGIGPSSAHALLTFLGRYDRLSIDSATVAHVSRTHMNGRKPTPRQIEKIYQRYGRWKNLVCWYEHWLNWETAKQIVREAKLQPA